MSICTRGLHGALSTHGCKRQYITKRGPIVSLNQSKCLHSVHACLPTRFHSALWASLESSLLTATIGYVSDRVENGLRGVMGLNWNWCFAHSAVFNSKMWPRLRSSIGAGRKWGNFATVYTTTLQVPIFRWCSRYIIDYYSYDDGYLNWSLSPHLASS